MTHISTDDEPSYELGNMSNEKKSSHLSFCYLLRHQMAKNFFPSDIEEKPLLGSIILRA